MRRFAIGVERVNWLGRSSSYEMLYGWAHTSKGQQHRSWPLLSDGALVVLKYIAAVWLTVAVWTPVALASDLTDTISARANARAGGAVSERDKELLGRYGCESGTRSASCQNEQRAKQKVPRSYETERALKAKADKRARAQAQAAAAARAKLKATQPNDSGGGRIKPAIATGATAAPKEDLQQTTVVTKPPSTPAQDAPAAATCRKYSPAVGGMVEVPC
jgi:hypothetical protein